MPAAASTAKNKNKNKKQKLYQILVSQALPLMPTLFVLFIYSVQDATHVQIVPNFPIIFIMVAAATGLFSMTARIVSFLIFVLYFIVHYLLLDYRYSTNPALVSTIVIFAHFYFASLTLLLDRKYQKRIREMKAEIERQKDDECGFDFYKFLQMDFTNPIPENKPSPEDKKGDIEK